MRIWFVRHGETEHNINRIFQGQLDTELTEAGREQARLTAAALAGVPFARVYASDLLRAFDTAGFLVEHREIEVVADRRLRELHYGVLQGIAYTEFRDVLAKHGVDASWGSGVFSADGTAPPEGESLADLVDRTSTFIEEVSAAAQEDEDVAVVTHGGTIRTIMTELLGMKPTARSSLALANCGVTCFSGGPGSWQLEFHNRVYWGDGLAVSHHTI